MQVTVTRPLSRALVLGTLAVTGLGCSNTVEGPPGAADAAGTGSSTSGTGQGGTGAEGSIGSGGVGSSGGSLGGTAGTGSGGSSEPGTGTLGDIAKHCTGTRPSASFAPLRRLNADEYVNTVTELTGRTPSAITFPPDERIGSFHANTNSAVSSAAVEAYYRAADSLANELTATAASLSGLVGCDASEGEACAASFIREFGGRAFRRPLTSTEEQALLTTYRVGTVRSAFAGGIRLVLQALLTSPYFLYHVETTAAGAGGPVLLGSYEIAARLSYFLTSSPPDAELRAAAAAGELAEPMRVRAHAERLLSTPSSEKSLRSFHQQWLMLTELSSVEKDSTLFPGWGPELVASLEQETSRFVSYVFRRGDGLFQSLVSAPYSFVDERLASVYGVTPSADPNEPTALDPTKRAGLLTQAGFLAAKAHPNLSSPVRRGVSVLGAYFCQELPPPPPDVMATAPTPVSNKTTRELYAEHSDDDRCRGCHSMIDPIGFALENYDAVGAYREVENGMPVDASGAVVGVDPAVDGSLNGARELADRIARSELARDCYATAMVTFALKRRAGVADACTARNLVQAFAASGYSVRELLLRIVEQDSFRHGVAEPL